MNRHSAQSHLPPGHPNDQTSQTFGSDGIAIKVVSERLGHANIAFTMQTYQHVLPGIQADAARSTERLAKPIPPPAADTLAGKRHGLGTTGSAEL